MHVTLVSNGLKRIDRSEFYQELIQLGFRDQAATEITSWIETINVAKPSFFSGKRNRVIKACLAHIGGRVFGESRQFSQHKVGLFYNVSPQTIQRSNKAYLAILQEAKTEIFKPL